MREQDKPHAGGVQREPAFGADVAVASGLITRAVPPEDLDEAVSTTLRELAGCERQGLTATKRLVNADALRSFDARVDDMVELSARLLASPVVQHHLEQFSS